MAPQLNILDSMLIGHEEIDAGHAEMANLVSRACRYAVDGTPVKIGPVMDELADSITRHLRKEEAFLERIGYYKLQGHRMEHVNFLNKFTAFHDRARARGFAEFDCGRLINIMLIEMISADMDIKSYLEFINDRQLFSRSRALGG